MCGTLHGRFLFPFAVEARCHQNKRNKAEELTPLKCGGLEIAAGDSARDVWDGSGVKHAADVM